MARHRRERRSRHIGARILVANVEHEYERKGYSHERSKYIGGAVAGKVYREQQAKRHRRRF
ncbi:MAG: hypothetical protein KGH64_00755 [Candidatus Micrarchaeota archaeon]|nr:hypothetical protein [Candidatus Micrarchaeota archaeon]